MKQLAFFPDKLVLVFLSCVFNILNSFNALTRTLLIRLVFSFFRKKTLFDNYLLK